MRDIHANDSGVTAMLEYIITFVFAFIIFTILLSMFDGMFIKGPERTVSIVQFADVGNDVTAKILDTYLIAPATGNVSTVFDMPPTAAGREYLLDIRSSANGWDKEVVVHSTYTGINLSVTLNGVNSTIPIDGSTSSMSPVHRVRYDS
ncbi:MAG: hypothetical protein A4E28_01625 [Methanocella sp. PtaU1.Bin125]|nr:MAG: hypothetical protein A4E28_01625 [Methanocella sp. PtaU1.Bin125]